MCITLIISFKVIVCFRKIFFYDVNFRFRFFLNPRFCKKKLVLHFLFLHEQRFQFWLLLGFIFPAKTKLSCLRLNAASKRSCSSSVSELFGYLYRSSGVVYCNKSVNGLISLCFITGLSIYPDVDKISIEL
jgi:hypothetical protein